MSVIENFAIISQVITKVINFATNNENIMSEFYKAYKNENANYTQDNFYEFIFSKSFEKNKDSVILQYINENKNITEEEKNIVLALENAYYSIFEIKKVQKYNFKVYNIINETELELYPLVKMSHLREVQNGCFIDAFIFKYDNLYYILSITDLIPSYQKDIAYSIGLDYLLNNTYLLYLDNPIKQEELKNALKNEYNIFVKTFEKDTILTTNVSIDLILRTYENALKNIFDESKEYLKKIKEPDNFEYCEIDAISNNNSYEDFFKEALKGYENNSKEYNVLAKFDPNYGLLLLPFYGSLCKILEGKVLENQKEIIMSIVDNDNVPPSIIIDLYNKYPNFLNIVNNILDENFKTLEEILDKYKYLYKIEEKYANTNILYHSKLFEETTKLTQVKDIKCEQDNEEYNNYLQVGRNEPCPCGSGKKYKKCCGA